MSDTAEERIEALSREVRALSVQVDHLRAERDAALRGTTAARAAEQDARRDRDIALRERALARAAGHTLRALLTEAIDGLGEVPSILTPLSLEPTELAPRYGRDALLPLGGRAASARIEELTLRMAHLVFVVSPGLASAPAPLLDALRAVGHSLYDHEGYGSDFADYGRDAAMALHLDPRGLSLTWNGADGAPHRASVGDADE